MKHQVMFSSKTDLWATPQELFDALDAEFGFTLDACALPENAKCDAYYTPEQDGLSEKWHGTVWCNPPYGRDVSKWIEKAVQHAKHGGGGCDAAPREDGHKMVSRIHIRQGGNQILKRSFEIRRLQKRSAISKYGVRV